MSIDDSNLDRQLDDAFVALTTDDNTAVPPAELMWARIAAEVEAVVQAHATDSRTPMVDSGMHPSRGRRWWYVGVAAAAILVATSATFIARHERVAPYGGPRLDHTRFAAAAPLLERIVTTSTPDAARAVIDIREGKQLLAVTRAHMDTLGATAVSERALLSDLEYALVEVIQGAASDPTDRALFAETIERRALVKRLRASLADESRGDGE
jgi:hypothetical protein